jgi:hypothetical protein
MVMVHGDNRGLVLPPRVAPTQVVVVPILTKDGSAAIIERTKLIVKELKGRGVRVECDLRDNYRPGSLPYSFIHLPYICTKLRRINAVNALAPPIHVQRTNSQFICHFII